jgi:hypothetical protein
MRLKKFKPHDQNKKFEFKRIDNFHNIFQKEEVIKFINYVSKIFILVNICINFSNF